MFENKGCHLRDVISYFMLNEPALCVLMDRVSLNKSVLLEFVFVLS